MSAVIDTQPVTSALLAMLQGATDYPVGDHDAPKPSVGFPEPTSGRYSVLHGIEGGASLGTLGEPDSEAVLVYQVNSYGRSRAQCEWMASRVRSVMLSRAVSGSFTYAIPVVGWVVSNRAKQTYDFPTNEGRDDQGTDLWACRDRFEVTVVPA
jgi:hypothetical protein